MNVPHICKCCAVSALVALAWNFGWDRAIFAQPGQADVEKGVEVLTRGPVHEAFAETVTFDPAAGIVVPKAPPAAIEELPPDQKPEGANVAWIPGYWGWDDERSDFLWVSGVWRSLPPGRQWVPGYWGKSRQGFQWTSGYWADAKTSEVEYLPEPPETVEAGPNIATPSADSTWIPGSWVWQQGRYAWRPGFWATVQPNWIWIPDHYVWAPRGYVFVNGYWDYSIGRRGVLFAPVYFNRGVYARPGFSYSPTTVIDLGVFANYLFLRPRYQHYYFGDYYAANYQSAGFLPWFSFQSSRFGYDPIYAHQRWQYRQDPQWERRLQTDFQLRRDQEGARPPRTWAAQRALSASGVNLPERGPAVAAPLSELATRKDNSWRFQPLNAEARQALSQHRQEVERTRDERRQLETVEGASLVEKPAQEFVPTKARLPKSSIMAKSAAELDKDQAPPKMYEAPQPDLKVAPKPRGRSSGEVKSKSSGEVKSKSSGEVKSKSSGEVKSKSSGEVKSRSSGEVKSRSSGEVKSRSSGDVKSRSGGESKGKSKT